MGTHFPCKVTFTPYLDKGKDLNMKQLKRLKEHDLYDLWEEEYEGAPRDCPPIKMVVARNKCGEYIGDKETARLLCEKYAIAPEAREEGGTCIIGWSEATQKYYGWSHRALFGFKIGDKIYEDGFGDDDTRFDQHGTKAIETKEDARRSALNFAESYS
jgi:hypothetical protein